MKVLVTSKAGNTFWIDEDKVDAFQAAQADDTPLTPEELKMRDDIVAMLKGAAEG